MSLLRILAKKKTSSTLNSSTQQTTSTNSTPNLEPTSLFRFLHKKGQVIQDLRVICLARFFLSVLLQVPVNVDRMEKN